MSATLRKNKLIPLETPVTTLIFQTDAHKRKIATLINDINTCFILLENVSPQARDSRLLTVCGITYMLDKVTQGAAYETSIGCAIIHGTQLGQANVYGIEASESYLQTLYSGLKKMTKVLREKK